MGVTNKTLCVCGHVASMHDQYEMLNGRYLDAYPCHAKKCDCTDFEQREDMLEIKLKYKPRATVAIHFTGKNSKEVAEWIRSRGGKAVAGGSYVNIFDPEDGCMLERVRKGDYVVVFGDDSGIFGVGDEEYIEANFNRVK